MNFSRVAFETDLPRIEVFGPPNDCNRSTGVGCVNPPNGATFYPIFTTRGPHNECLWQEGGANIPGTTRTFGGNSHTEYGALLKLVYADSVLPGSSPVITTSDGSCRTIPVPSFRVVDR